MSDVTRILSQIETGDASAAEQLLPLVYDELRKLAAAKLSLEKPGLTVQATALVHDAYIRLVDLEKSQHWNSRGHFFAAAAEAMRRILVENARRRKREIHGGKLQRVPLTDICVTTDLPPDSLIALTDALEKLCANEPQVGQLVKLHCFAGLTIEQAAELVGISPRTAYRDWNYARGWLYRAMEQATESDSVDPQ